MSLMGSDDNDHNFESSDPEARSTEIKNLGKRKSPYSEDDYEFMREETKRMLIDKFHLSEEKAQARADSEIQSLKEIFSKMPEFV